MGILKSHYHLRKLSREDHPGGSWMSFPNFNGAVNLGHAESEHSEVVEEYLGDEVFHFENMLEMLLVSLNVNLVKA